MKFWKDQNKETEEYAILCPHSYAYAYGEMLANSLSFHWEMSTQRYSFQTVKWVAWS